MEIFKKLAYFAQNMRYRRVKLIENTSFSIDQKVDILLVYAGVKPATLIDLVQDEYWSEQRVDTAEQNEELIESALKLFNKLKLKSRSLDFELFPYIVKTETENNGIYYKERTPLIISRSEEIVNRFEKAIRLDDQREIGRCFGYPETAIQAYLGERDAFIGDFYEHNCVEEFFTGFIFSKEYYLDEIKTSKRWHDLVKKLSKKIYKEIEDEDLILELDFLDI